MKNTWTGILEQSMAARSRVGIGLSYRPHRLHRLAESISGLLKSFKIPSLKSKICDTVPLIIEILAGPYK
jgi:hypothetical protein